MTNQDRNVAQWIRERWESAMGIRPVRALDFNCTGLQLLAVLTGGMTEQEFAMQEFIAERWKGVL